MKHGADIAAGLILRSKAAEALSTPPDKRRDFCRIGGFAHHGGRLCVARSLFPDVPQPWVDLSTGINPRSYPAPRASALARNRLPEPTELARLEAVAAAAFGVDDVARVVATGGTENALRLLPYLLRVSSAWVAGPTYGSHADAWTRGGVKTAIVADTDLAAHANSHSVLTVVNPNNPDGRIVGREVLHSLHDALQGHQGTLIVDEAFADIDPRISVASVAGSSTAPRMIVLRSFGKFYGLAGVRLGFVIAAPELATTLRHLLGDWPVSSDALSAGLAAYADHEWAERNRATLSSSAQKLDSLLVRSGMEIAGGTSLYRLARAADAQRRFTHLISHGILARPFDHDRSLLRFGLPGRRTEWRRLSTALDAFT